MPIAILLAVFVSIGTSFAAQGALPGDMLYPVKTEVNENIRTAFTFGADAKANLQADLLEERLEEAQALHAQGRLTGDTAVAVSSDISSQVKATTDAAAKSEASVGAKTNTRVQVGLENFLAIVGLDTSVATELNATLSASSLSTGTYTISSYLDDMKTRVNTLRVVVEKYQAELEASLYAELSAKLDTAALLVAEAQVKAEADARASLDQAATLVGEVESKLSTLGQAQVDVNTGIITDIDFSVDPMKIDAGTGASGSVSGSADSQRPQQIEPSTGEDPNARLNGGVGTDVEGTLETTSGLGL